jgi:hypothetical protein
MGIGPQRRPQKAPTRVGTPDTRRLLYGRPPVERHEPWQELVPHAAFQAVDHTRFYNVAGWGPAFAANAPPLVWFLAVSVHLVRLQ